MDGAGNCRGKSSSAASFQTATAGDVVASARGGGGGELGPDEGDGLRL
jgi:hypothetical protein